MKDEPNLPKHFCTHNYSIRIGLYGPKSFKKQAAISYSSPSPECTDFLGLWICFSEGPLQRLQDREREAKCVKLRTVLQPELEAGNCHLCSAVSVLGTYHGEIKLENHRIIKEKTSENQHF